MISGLNHSTIAVKDLDRSLKVSAGFKFRHKNSANFVKDDEIREKLWGKAEKAKNMK